MRVLIATNGSSHAEAALRLGAQISQQGHEPPTILTVLKHEADRTLPSTTEILVRACRVAGLPSQDVRTRVRVGHSATEIVREAEEGNYDLVIVGEGPNRHLVERFLMGSTMIRVVEHAPCPVIVAKGKIGPIQRILLCDSGSGDPSVGLSSGSSGAGESGRAGPSVLSNFMELPADLLDRTELIVVLHVMSQMGAGPGVRGSQLRDGPEELLEERAPEGELLRRDVEALESLGLHACAKVRHGLVVEEILAEVLSVDYDLVVIGAYRGQGWQRILLDDLAHRIVVEMDRPVLVVR